MKKALKSRQAKAVTKSGKYLVEEAKKRAGYTRPSLKQLRKLKHPYSKKNNPSGINSAALPHIGWYVHRRKLPRGPGKGLVTEAQSYRGMIHGYLRFTRKGPTYNVAYKKAAMNNHVNLVITGTKIMWGRDVIGKTAAMPKIRKKRWAILQEEMKKFVRTPFNPNQ